MLIFLFILTIGFVFEWNKGALDWTESLVLGEADSISKYKGGKAKKKNKC
jgi:hypothetical protein